MEKYIGECIDSFKDQITEDVEVIVVDDGSIDSSKKIIEEKIAQMPYETSSQFKLISQFNQGQSVARNNALDIASGEYIAFVDADDMVSDSYIKNIVSIVDVYSPDLIRVGAEKFVTTHINSITFLDKMDSSGSLSLNENLLMQFFNQNNWYTCLYILKKEFFNDLRFPVGVYFEDAHIFPELLLKCKNIYLDHSVYYYYRENPTGSTLSKDDKNIKKLINSSKKIARVYAERMQDNSIYSASYLAMSKMYINYLIEFKGIKKSYIAQKEIDLIFYKVDKSKVSDLKLKLYFYLKFKLVFLNFFLKKLKFFYTRK